MDVGARQSTYTEKPKEGGLEEALTKATNKTVVVTQGEKSKYETSGLGPHYGINYETMFLMQKFQYYTIDYDTLSYRYSVNGSTPIQSDLKVKAKGYDYKLGLKLGYFRPRISFKREDIQITSFNGTQSDTMMYLGYGMGVDFHLIQGLHIYAGYDKRFRISSDPLFSITTTDITFGIMFRPWDWFNFTGGGQKAKAYTLPFFQVF